MLTGIQSRGGGTGSSSPWLSIPSMSPPQVSTLRLRILSSCGCLGTGAPGRSPSRPRRSVGTRLQARGRDARELAEAGIRLERGGGDWKTCGYRGDLASA